MTLIVNEDTGAAFLKNEGVATQLIDAYEITSAAATLLPANWTPIAGNFDATGDGLGDGSVDSTSDWFVFPSDENRLTEVSLIPGSGQLSAGQIVSLGTIWDPLGAADLVLSFAVGVTVTTDDADFRSLVADYDGDLDIDQDDYAVFASTLGSTVDLQADGNGNGVVDASDYTIWRDAFDAFLPPSEPPVLARLFGAQGVPEPTTGTTSVIAIVATSMSAVRRRRRSGR